MFTRDIRSPEDIHQYYVAGYDDKRQLDGQTVNAAVNRKLLSLFALDLQGKSLLDVGSGYGMFLAQALDAGAQRVVGVELSDAERRYSLQELRLETYRDFSEFKVDDQFDVITLFEVIEHIPEPREFIASVAKYLKTSGSLIVGTDNFDCDVVKVLGDRFPKWIPHQHISLFTSASLRSTLEKISCLNIVGVASFTPWELLARKIVFKATGGRHGGKIFNLQAEETQETSRGYQFFALRRAFNGAWFKMTTRPNLNGEMMYVHAIKAHSRDAP
jgi:2-polyprenyl-3-methyl-5-hydroxy-6-metoxy-1,4-benzoquinol methylase